MTTGSQADVQNRLISYLPPWFGDGVTAIVSGVMDGAANVLAGIYAFYAYAKAQTRILTATGFWLDMIASDYFGSAIVRAPGQTDASFRAYIIANLLRPKATRPSMQALLLALTGQEPIIFEPWRPYDTGACSVPNPHGYCGVARAGSLATPFTCMITAYRPQAEGGFAGAAFANAPSFSAVDKPLSNSYLNSLSLDTITVDDADIYAAISANKVCGTICWVGLTYAPPPVSSPSGGGDGELDFSDPDNSQYIPGL